MAVNDLYNLYMGGDRPANANYGLMPAGSASNVVGYADHQRRRSYQVVRQMQFRPRVPYGGLGNDAVTDQKDWQWYVDLVAAGGNVAVDDVWNMIIIPPNTRVEYIAAWVFTGVTGLQFTVDVHDSDGVAVATATIAGIGNIEEGPILAAIDPDEMNDDEIRYVGIHVTAIPGTSGIAKLQGLDFAVQAEVVDWGSYDFNGNA